MTGSRTEYKTIFNILGNFQYFRKFFLSHFYVEQTEITLWQSETLKSHLDLFGKLHPNIRGHTEAIFPERSSVTFIVDQKCGSHILLSM